MRRPGGPGGTIEGEMQSIAESMIRLHPALAYEVGRRYRHISRYYVPFTIPRQRLFVNLAASAP